MEKSDILKALKDKENISLRELITNLAGILPDFVPAQQKYGVSTYPDERTIRFYMNRGLIDRPGKYRGASAVFSYRHMLQILSIKYLQSEYLPLKKIKAMLSGLSDKEMEDILLGGVRPDALTGSVPLPDSPERISSRKNRVLKQDIHMMLAEDDDIFCRIPETPVKKSSEEWLRVSISDDIEINIKAGSLPGGKKEKKEFIEKLSARLRMFMGTEKNRGV